MSSIAMLTVKGWAFLLSFSRPNPNSFFLAQTLFGLRDSESGNLVFYAQSTRTPSQPVRLYQGESLRIICHETGQHCINTDAQPGPKNSGKCPPSTLALFVQVGQTNSRADQQPNAEHRRLTFFTGVKNTPLELHLPGPPRSSRRQWSRPRWWRWSSPGRTSWRWGLSSCLFLGQHRRIRLPGWWHAALLCHWSASKQCHRLRNVTNNMSFFVCFLGMQPRNVIAWETQQTTYLFDFDFHGVEMTAQFQQSFYFQIPGLFPSK